MEEAFEPLKPQLDLPPDSEEVHYRLVAGKMSGDRCNDPYHLALNCAYRQQAGLNPVPGVFELPRFVRSRASGKGYRY